MLAAQRFGVGASKKEFAGTASQLKQLLAHDARLVAKKGFHEGLHIASVRHIANMRHLVLFAVLSIQTYII